jgi:hypothetical protein
MVLRHNNFAYAVFCVCACIDSMPVKLRAQAKIFFNLERMKKLIRLVLYRHRSKFDVRQDNTDTYTDIHRDIWRILSNQIQVSIFKKSFMEIVYNDAEDVLNTKINDSLRESFDVTDVQMKKIVSLLIDLRNKEACE